MLGEYEVLPMKRVFALLSLVSLAAGLCGCSEMTQEDKEFYGRGWIHPGELDQERPTKMPAHPETTGSLGSAPAATAPSTASGLRPMPNDTEWTATDGR